MEGSWCEEAIISLAEKESLDQWQPHFGIDLKVTLNFQVKVKLTPLAEPAVTESVKATPATTMTTPATPTTSAALDEKTSRSGRLIKPRKFVDASPENSPPPHPPATTVSPKLGFKIWSPSFCRTHEEKSRFWLLSRFILDN